MPQLPSQLPALPEGPNPAAPPPDAYAVLGPDGIYYGWAKTLEQTLTIAASIALRSMMDVDVVDPDGNVHAHIGEFTPPQAETKPILYLILEADAHDPLRVNATTNKPGASIDWGDGSSSTLADTTGSHIYTAADAYHAVASLEGETAEAWVALATPPTIDLELGAKSGATEEGM